MAGLAALVCVLLMAMIATSRAQTEQENAPRNQNGQDQAAGNNDGLVIEPTELPTTYPHGRYQVIFRPRGNFVPGLHWKVEKGVLPPGIKLEERGVLHGSAERAGEYRFTLSVRDSGSPQQAVQREFVIKVVEAITLVWQVPAHVTGSRIDGSVEVSNTTVDDVDLTFDVKAVAENGRATEIGYQHFPLTKGTVGMALPFGDTLPYGAYVIYVNVVGEVGAKNLIYREHLQTPRPLRVLVGP
jgi:hypothetical protein